MTDVNLAYKYLLQPTEEQQKLLDTCFAVSRKAWNTMVAKYDELKEDKITKHSEKVKICRTAFSELKKLPESTWMYVCPSRFLDFLVNTNFNTAWDKYFKAIKNGDLKKAQQRYRERCALSNKKFKQKYFDNIYRPKFKSWKDEQSFQVDNRGAKFDLTQNHILLASNKIENNTPIKLKIKKDDKIWAENILKFNSFTFSRTKSGKYYLSVGINAQRNIQEVAINSSVGIDLGVKDYVTVGEIKVNMRSPERMYVRMKQLQDKAALKYQTNKDNPEWGRKNYDKIQQKIRKIHEKIANQRKYDTHSFTHALTQSFDFIAVEDLNVKGMTKESAPKLGEDGHTFVRNNKKQKASLNRNILNNNFFETVRQIKYKQEWQGKKSQKIGRFEPTSKTCHCCGWKYQTLQLHERTWSCQSCGVVHDRDINASKNIESLGLKEAGVNTPFQNASPQGEERTSSTASFLFNSSTEPLLSKSKENLSFKVRRQNQTFTPQEKFINLLSNKPLYVIKETG